ncbi:hypothetical protein C9E85_04040 [Plesiomonas shigelloides]|nr:hypothetical protein C9E85_04040 [Plesiomonas shigelloides]
MPTALLYCIVLRCIPFLLEAAAVLATFVHPNHIVYLCSWGFTHLPPICNFKLFGYIPKRLGVRRVYSVNATRHELRQAAHKNYPNQRLGPDRFCAPAQYRCGR